MPAGHRDGPPLYGRMMKSITSGHDYANRVRMLKLPLILTEAKLYAGAIAQFYWLSDALEAQLRRHEDHPMVVKISELGLCVTPGYASDLEELFGEGWREVPLRHARCMHARCARLPTFTPAVTPTPARIPAPRRWPPQPGRRPQRATWPRSRRPAPCL